MVKELQKKFIKTTMLVVSILLVVFLVSINVINYTLAKRDNNTTLNKIISINLRSIPGIQAANSIPSGQNGKMNELLEAGEPEPPAEAMERMTEAELSAEAMEGMTEPELPAEAMEGMTEPELPAEAMEGMTEPELPAGTNEPMSEGGPASNVIENRREDLGRYAVAHMNADGVIVFKDLAHDPDMQFSDLVNLINAANVDFAPKATGETETEPGEAGSTPPAEEGSVPPGEAGSTPPAEEGSVPQGEAGSTPSAEEGSVPPGEVGSTPPGEAGSNPPAEAGSTPPGEAGSNSPAEAGSTPPGEAGNNPPAASDSGVPSGGGAAPLEEGETVPREARGTVDGYMYYASQMADGSVLYAFLNISEQIEATIRIILITIALGAALWFLILLVVVFLSKKAIAPIAESIEKQRQFITDAGHEIKTPLAVIVSNVDVQELHSGKTKWLDNIRAQALRLSDLTKQMLTLSKMEESGSSVFVATTFDASKELEEMVRIFREPASLRGIAVRTDIEPGVQIHFSKEQFQQMAELLLDNAMKYGKEHGFLSVSLHGEKRTILLSFKNDCDKLPDIDPDRLFERFYRSDSSRSRQTGGSGIGLAVVRAIAEHGGGYAKAHFLPDNVIEFEIQMQKKTKN